ncbi:Fic protein [Volvox carteri f. nagariensis]|uniref:Fic protein n=1 Tax=Volvox carteri f. nagariensis TaxID=3068 RepID=D8U8M4_VOLCA|nr:Fic protein [Volvox carteri f. nagariensis]EFJ43947.1 Fic protein [Volvox carteri f. nagariensis]|eukprot:XP_002954959.1 Fic protein [Volvox carteri f. nagariensis]
MSPIPLSEIKARCEHLPKPRGFSQWKKQGWIDFAKANDVDLSATAPAAADAQSTVHVSPPEMPKVPEAATTCKDSTPASGAPPGGTSTHGCNAVALSVVKCALKKAMSLTDEEFGMFSAQVEELVQYPGARARITVTRDKTTKEEKVTLKVTGYEAKVTEKEVSDFNQPDGLDQVIQYAGIGFKTVVLNNVWYPLFARLGRLTKAYMHQMCKKHHHKKTPWSKAHAVVQLIRSGKPIPAWPAYVVAYIKNARAKLLDAAGSTMYGSLNGHALQARQDELLSAHENKYLWDDHAKKKMTFQAAMQFNFWMQKQFESLHQKKMRLMPVFAVKRSHVRLDTKSLLHIFCSLFPNDHNVKLMKSFWNQDAFLEKCGLPGSAHPDTYMLPPKPPDGTTDKALLAQYQSACSRIRNTDAYRSQQARHRALSETEDRVVKSFFRCLPVKNGYKFDCSISTDGVAVSLQYSKPSKAVTAKRKRSAGMRSSNVATDAYDQNLDMYDPEEGVLTLGLDPGRCSLATVSVVTQYTLDSTGKLKLGEKLNRHSWSLLRGEYQHKSGIRTSTIKKAQRDAPLQPAFQALAVPGCALRTAQSGTVLRYIADSQHCMNEWWERALSRQEAMASFQGYIGKRKALDSFFSRVLKEAKKLVPKRTKIEVAYGESGITMSPAGKGEHSNYYECPWEEDNPELVWTQVEVYLREIKKIQPGGKAAELLQSHAEWSVLCSIFFSNLIEGKGLSQSNTASLVRAILQGQQSLPSNSSSSNKRGKKSAQDVTQHAVAFVFLKQHIVVEKKKLTPQVVLDAHKILMDGMVREDGLAISAGSYRSTIANAGYHLFPPPASVERSLAVLLEEYNERAASSEEDPFALAAWLSYEFVSIHPFEDGNGRMCRLLLNMVLLSFGVPFCSALGFSSGHRQAKQQYLQSIQNARKHGGLPKRLAFIVLCSIRSSLAAFFETLRVSAKEEYPRIAPVLEGQSSQQASSLQGLSAEHITGDLKMHALLCAMLHARFKILGFRTDCVYAISPTRRVEAWLSRMRGAPRPGRALPGPAHALLPTIGSGLGQIKVKVLQTASDLPGNPLNDTPLLLTDLVPLLAKRPKKDGAKTPLPAAPRTFHYETSQSVAEDLPNRTLALCRAGRAKTHTIVTAAKRHGKVLVCCPWNAQTRSIACDHGVDTCTFNALIGMDSEDSLRLAPKDVTAYDVIVFDEVMLLPHRSLVLLQRYMQRHSQKRFYTTGDPSQLEPIGSNVSQAALVKAVKQLFPNTLTIRKSARAVDGERLLALEADLLEGGMPVEQVAAKYFKTVTLSEALSLGIGKAVAYYNRTVDRLNAAFHSHASGSGASHGAPSHADGISPAPQAAPSPARPVYRPGDRLVCRTTFWHDKARFCTNYQYEVVSSECTTITLRDLGGTRAEARGCGSATPGDESKAAVQPPASSARSPKETHALSAERVRECFRSSYCVTVHSAQGQTFEGKLLIGEWSGNPFASSNWFYTALTRTRCLDDVYLLVERAEQWGHPPEQPKSMAAAMVEGYRSQDRAAGRPTDSASYVTADWILSCLRACGGLCRGCGRFMVLETNNESKPTVNRLNNALPHTQENCELLCKHCNTGKPIPAWPAYVVAYIKNARAKLLDAAGSTMYGSLNGHALQARQDELLSAHENKYLWDDHAKKKMTFQAAMQFNFWMQKQFESLHQKKMRLMPVFAVKRSHVRLDTKSLLHIFCSLFPNDHNVKLMKSFWNQDAFLEKCGLPGSAHPDTYMLPPKPPDGTTDKALLAQYQSACSRIRNTDAYRSQQARHRALSETEDRVVKSFFRCLPVKNGYKFDCSISTDGVAVSLQYSKPSKAVTAKRKRSAGMRSSNVATDAYDQNLDMYDPEEGVLTLGLDPGRCSLATVSVVTQYTLDSTGKLKLGEKLNRHSWSLLRGEYQHKSGIRTSTIKKAQRDAPLQPAFQALAVPGCALRTAQSGTVLRYIADSQHCMNEWWERALSRQEAMASFQGYIGKRKALDSFFSRVLKEAKKLVPKRTKIEVAYGESGITMSPAGKGEGPCVDAEGAGTVP